jgi:hypothetical protein
MILGALIVLAAMLFMIERRNKFPESYSAGCHGLLAAGLFVMAAVFLMQVSLGCLVTA